MQKPLISLTVAYLSGLLLGHGFLYVPYSAVVFALLLIAAAGILALAGTWSYRRCLLYLIPGMIGMAAYVYSAAWLPADHYTRRVSFDRGMHEFTGTVSSPLNRTPDRTAFVMRLSRIDGTTVRGNVRVSVRGESPFPGYGDLVRLRGRMRAPGSFGNPGGFDYAAYLARSGIFATVSARTAEDITVLSRGSGVFRTIQDWRERIRQAFLAGTSGSGSAVLQAMVLGEEGGLTEELRDRFLAAGVTHIISISGSHLGMVALLCFGLIRGILFLLPERQYHRLTLRADPKKIAAWLTLPLVVFYTLLAGGEVATVRSLIMITAGLAALILDREHALIYSLAISALCILTVSPQAVFDISFQLSYLSVLVIGYVVSVWNELGMESTGWRRFARSMVLLLIISLATSLATGPVVARYFNQFSLAGIVSNLIIVPFAGAVVVPLGLFSGILSLFTGRLPMAWLNQIAADVFIECVSFFSRLPCAEFHPQAPAVPWLACYAIFLLSLFAALRIRLVSRFKPFEGSARVPPAPKVVLIVTGPLLICGLAVSFVPRHQTMISFLDVGEGDCALIELASGKTILVDGGGTHDNRFDIGRRVVAPYLWNRGIHRLDLVVLSHPEADHMNGLFFLIRRFPVAEVWVPGNPPDHSGYRKFMETVKENHVRSRTVSASDAPIALGGAKLRVLHPGPDFRPKKRNVAKTINDRSLVVRVDEGDRSYLFAGDIEADAEKLLTGGGRALRCDVLKVPHHGSKSSSSELFVSRTGPGIAVVSVGRENPYRHPSNEVVERYERAGARIFRTDRDGAVLIRAGREGLDSVRWRELILRRIDLADRASWAGRERLNWRRLRLRTWGI